MGDIVYLRIIGEKQGDISSGCGTYASVGNRWQVGHEDEIFAFALTNAITSTGKGVNLQGLQFANSLIKAHRYCLMPSIRMSGYLLKSICIV
mgnify:CR=1 FL=1